MYIIKLIKVNIYSYIAYTIFYGQTKGFLPLFGNPKVIFLLFPKSVGKHPFPTEPVDGPFSNIGVLLPSSSFFFDNLFSIYFSFLTELLPSSLLL
jgi:hypothetical protein